MRGRGYIYQRDGCLNLSALFKYIILGATASQDAKALLLRIQNGEFGSEPSVAARKALEWLNK